MDPDGVAAWAAYLEHLSDEDLRVVAARAQAGPSPERMRSEPQLLAAGLADPGTFDAVFGPPGDEEPLGRLSPFLVFAVAVERARVDVEHSGFVPEWLGPRRRVPVFGPTDLREFLADPWRRLFLDPPARVLHPCDQRQRVRADPTGLPAATLLGARSGAPGRPPRSGPGQ